MAVAVDDRQCDGGGLGALDRAGVEAECVERGRGAVGHEHGGTQSAAELTHDAGRVQAVADHVTHRHREPVAGQLGQVVPVSTDVQGAHGRPVAHGRPATADAFRHRQHRGLEGQGDLALTGVGPAQPLVDLLKFPGAGVQLRLQHLGPVTVAVALGADQLGDLLHPVQQQYDAAVGAEDRGVDRLQ